MSARPLPALLVEPDEAGAFYLAASDLGPLQAVAAELGFRCVGVDLAGCVDKPELMRRVAKAFAFPDYFGHNWDALDDCLRDLAWLPGEGYVLGLEHPEALRRAAPGDFASLVSVLEEASLAWCDRGIPFWAFIALPDAEFEDLPS